MLLIDIIVKDFFCLSFYKPLLYTGFDSHGMEKCLSFGSKILHLDQHIYQQPLVYYH